MTDAIMRHILRFFVQLIYSISAHFCNVYQKGKLFNCFTVYSRMSGISVIGVDLGKDTDLKKAPFQSANLTLQAG